MRKIRNRSKVVPFIHKPKPEEIHKFHEQAYDKLFEATNQKRKKAQELRKELNRIIERRTGTTAGNEKSDP